MKLYILFSLAATANAFSFVARGAKSSSTKLYAEGQGRINSKIDLESPKVATMETLETGNKKVYCRCWQSDTFPFCNGAHMKHNEVRFSSAGLLSS